MDRTPPPGPRYDHAIAYDSARGVTVLFGGCRRNNYCGDTWEWDGSTWTRGATTGPSPRASHALAYDSARGVTVLFGGSRSGGPFGDTWEFWPDCNSNGIPDECDIADCANDPLCDDCNSNGTPDGCELGERLPPAGTVVGPVADRPGPAPVPVAVLDVPRPHSPCMRRENDRDGNCVLDECEERVAEAVFGGPGRGFMPF